MLDGLAGLISARSVEDVFAERVRVRLDGTEFVLPVLPIAAEEEWKASLDSSFRALVEGVSGAADTSEILAILDAAPGQMLDALVTYDRTGVLGGRDAIRERATKMQVIRAVLEVWQAANPLVAIALAAMTREAPRNGSPPPTSSSPPSTAGRRKRRAAS